MEAVLSSCAMLRKWLAGIAAAVVGGIVLYLLTGYGGLFKSKKAEVQIISFGPSPSTSLPGDDVQAHVEVYNMAEEAPARDCKVQWTLDGNSEVVTTQPFGLPPKSPGSFNLQRKAPDAPGQYKSKAVIGCADSVSASSSPGLVLVAERAALAPEKVSPSSPPSQKSMTCLEGEYFEGNTISWNLKRTDNLVEMKRSDGACWASFSRSSDKWEGSLECNNGAKYDAALIPSEDCTAIPTTLAWFKLHR